MTTNVSNDVNNKGFNGSLWIGILLIVLGIVAIAPFPSPQNGDQG